MKKLLLLAILAAAALPVFAGTGTAVMYPSQAPTSFYGFVAELRYAPDAAGPWTNGSIEVIVPPDFTIAPQNTVQAADGYVEAFIMRGGTNPEQVPGTNIFVSGYAITVTAVTMATNDYLKVIYGSNAYGGQGITTPMYAAKYIFQARVAPTGAGYAPLNPQPYLDVNNLKLIKTSSHASAMAGDTVTFTLTYQNISSSHQINSITVWDTLPFGFSFLGASMPHTAIANMYIFPANTLMYSQSLQLTITAKVIDGAIGYGTSMLNTASARGNDMYGNTFNASAQAQVEIYGVHMATQITAAPDLAVPGQVITVIMRIDNDGNTRASNLMPGAMTLLGTGGAALMTGPVPAVLSQLQPLSSGYFTWTYQATMTGSVQFSASATSKEGLANTTVYGVAALSNAVAIVPPTATPTFTQTRTFTATPTWTATLPPPTVTYTYTPTATKTFTLVPAETDTPTATSTATAAGPTHTATYTPVPKDTPDAPVYTDKNYIEIGKEDVLTVNYKAPKDGVVTIIVHNISGELVKSLVKENVTAGYHSAQWDGTNNKGNKVGRGVYFVFVKQGEWKVIKRVVVLK